MRLLERRPGRGFVTFAPICDRQIQLCIGPFGTKLHAIVERFDAARVILLLKLPVAQTEPCLLPIGLLRHRLCIKDRGLFGVALLIRYDGHIPKRRSKTRVRLQGLLVRLSGLGKSPFCCMTTPRFTNAFSEPGWILSASLYDLIDLVEFVRASDMRPRD